MNLLSVNKVFGHALAFLGACILVHVTFKAGRFLVDYGRARLNCGILEEIKRNREVGSIGVAAQDNDDACCIICLNNPREVVLRDCGHGGLCADCTGIILKSMRARCPLCRAQIYRVGRSQ